MLQPGLEVKAKHFEETKAWKLPKPSTIYSNEVLPNFLAHVPKFQDKSYIKNFL